MMLSILFVFISIQLSLSAEISTTDFGYHHYNDLSSLLRNYSARFPTKTHLYSIGKSVQGRDLWVMAIAESNPDRHEIMRPEAKYIGNMHGNESPSREVVLHFLDYMLNNEANDPSVQFLMKNTRIHVMPTMNPDGFEGSIVTDCTSVHGRYNANNFDLNRNFPDHFENNAVPIQPETSAVMQWLAANDFVLSANMHEGSLVVNYPYDNYANSFDGLSRVSLCDDDDVFRAMALNYTANNVEMRSNQIQCNIGESFVNGTTNGAAWYPATGTMQDYNYWKRGCMEVTLELGCCKYPLSNQLKNIWEQNKQALLDYMRFANTGVRGIVKFSDGTIGTNLTIQIDSREPAFKTNSNGEYYRILLPGNYQLSVLIACQKIYQTKISVPTDGLKLIVYNITLDNNHLMEYKGTKNDNYALYCSEQN